VTIPNVTNQRVRAGKSYEQSELDLDALF